MRELGELRAKRHVRGSGDELSSIHQFCFALQRNEETRRHCSARTRESVFVQFARSSQLATNYAQGRFRIYPELERSEWRQHKSGDEFAVG